MRISGTVFTAILAAVTVAASAQGIRSSEQIEADWLRQNQLRGTTGASSPVTAEADAAGGVDGVKDGKWGFHTVNEEHPWWQVDLEETVAIEQVLIYNRTELAERNSRILVLLSSDGENFRQVYQHDGTVFYGFSDTKPLDIRLDGQMGRYLRLQHPGTNYFHLDEVEVYCGQATENIALNKPATQSSVSQWSKAHTTHQGYNSRAVVEGGVKLAESLAAMGASTRAQLQQLAEIGSRLEQDGDNAQIYLQARRIVRSMAFSNPLLDFDSMLFVKRVPPAFPHMSDQYYGWWSRAGGGVYLLENFKSDSPVLRCLTAEMPEGSFMRPDISHDGTKVLFAYCRFYEQTHAMQKADKSNLPEDCFYSLYEMNIDGSGLRRMTRGRYDDFDGRYLPNGDIIFLSTRKGQSVQYSRSRAAMTMLADLPDSYVRCGGDNWRPVPVFTLHRMDGGGGDIRPISAFENFEWTPTIAADGRIMYARWDYIDRFNGPFISLWSANQDGTNSQLVYGNYTSKPQCVFEARAIPDSQKLVFTAAAHHSNMGGSLVLLDRTGGTEYERPLQRLTPEVCFPETEGWPQHYYANPYPLSEEYFLVSWSDKPLPPHSFVTTDERNPVNAQGIYLYDAFGNLELLYRDTEISSMYPMPVRPRSKPPVQPDTLDWDGPQHGHFLVQDVYQGLTGIERGTIKRLRIIGVPPKVQPHMNNPSIGISKEDPGKFVIGTVPVESDGSAYTLVPSGIPVFFQALDDDGMAVQTMRSLTYVQPGQTLSCIGCHESREAAPASAGTPLAARREPSKPELGPSGSWPLRFDELVGPVLRDKCVSCHTADNSNVAAAALDLTVEKAYANLMALAGKNLETLAFEKDYSEVGDCPARKSVLLKTLRESPAHPQVGLDDESLERLVTWMDVYAQRLGSFSDEQEQQLRSLKRELAAILSE